MITKEAILETNLSNLIFLSALPPLAVLGVPALLLFAGCFDEAFMLKLGFLFQVEIESNPGYG
jgi:hypothetical protein